MTRLEIAERMLSILAQYVDPECPERALMVIKRQVEMEFGPAEKGPSYKVRTQVLVKFQDKPVKKLATHYARGG